MHYQRGQTLPLWIGGILATMSLIFFMLNYAYTFAWQVKAQNAADSAAQTIVNIQAEEWNQMSESMYAAMVEEYRMRHLLDSMIMVAHGNGGCWDGSSPAPLSTCSAIYSDLWTAFMQSENRYTNDVVLFQNESQNVNNTTIVADANATIDALNSSAACSTPGAVTLDCSFQGHYNILAATERTTNLQDVGADGLSLYQARYGNGPGPIPSLSSFTWDDKLFAPLRVEVAVCKTDVVPLVQVVGSFFGFKASPFTIVARAAATDAMVEQDWLQPGANNDPLTNFPYQPQESYSAGYGPLSNEFGSAYDWYAVHYGGNPWTADDQIASHPFSYNLGYDEFSARVGWWNAIPDQPFSGQQTTAQLCGTSSTGGTPTPSPTP